MTNKSGLGLGMVVASIAMAFIGGTVGSIFFWIFLAGGLFIQLLEAIKE